MTPFASLGRLCGSCCSTLTLASQHAASRFTMCSPAISAFARELSTASMRGSTCCRPAKLDHLRGLQLHQQNQIYGCYFGGWDILPLDDALQKQTRLRRVLVDMWCCWAQSHPRAIHDLRECVKLSADWPSTCGNCLRVHPRQICFTSPLACTQPCCSRQSSSGGRGGVRLHQGFSNASLGNGASLL